MPFCIGWGENFDKIALSCTVKGIEANFCFSIFGKNSKIQNGRHFWEEENFFENCQEYIASYTLWVENFEEIALSRMVKEIEANLCFSIFLAKIRKYKMQPFLGRGNFFENCQEYIAQIPCGSKISTKSLISHG